MKLRSGILVLLSVCSAACHHAVEAEAPTAPQKLACVAVVTKQVRDVVEVRGTVAPRPERDAVVSAQVAGRVLKVEVREGDVVRQGDVLARIDDAALADLSRQADAALGKARAERQNADTTLGRTTKVFERGIAARQEVDDAQARAAGAVAAEQDAVAASSQAHRQLARATLTSPIGGVVLKVLRKPGELVDGTPATPVVEVADLSALELVADVPAADLVRLEKNAAAQISFTALPGGYTGQVSLVSRTVDRTSGVGVVRIAIEVGKAPVPPVGLYGVARVDRGELHDALLVPVSALRRDAAGATAVVVCGDDKKAHVQAVRVGTASGGLVEVTGVTAAAKLAGVAPLAVGDGDAIEVGP